MENLGDKIYQLRKLKGLSQEEFSFEIGVSRQAVSKWENGLMSPNLENLKVICKVYQLDLNYFLDEPEINSEATNEVAAKESITDTSAVNVVSESVKTDTKTNRLWLISVIIISVLLAFSIFGCIICSIINSKPTEGWAVVEAERIEYWFFILFIILNVILACALVFLIIYRLKKKNVNKS